MIEYDKYKRLTNTQGSRNLPNDFGTPPTFAWLLVDRFIVDERYQRIISSARSQKLIRHIADNFRWSEFRAIDASPRDPGWYAVRDGQHRIEAAKLCQIELVPSILTDALSIEAEAHSFVATNFARVSVDRLTLQRAKLVAGDAEASEIDRLVKAAGLRLSPFAPNKATVRAGDVYCVSTLGMLIKRYDPAIALGAILAVADAYRDEVYGIRAPFLLAAAEVLTIRGADRVTLTAAFKQSTAAALYVEPGPGAAKNHSKHHVSIAAILRERLKAGSVASLGRRLPCAPIADREPQILERTASSPAHAEPIHLSQSDQRVLDRALRKSVRIIHNGVECISDPERAAVADHVTKPPEAADDEAVDGAASTSETNARPLRGGGSSPRNGDTGKPGEDAGGDGGSPLPNDAFQRYLELGELPPPMEWDRRSGKMRRI